MTSEGAVVFGIETAQRKSNEGNFDCNEGSVTYVARIEMKWLL